VVAETNRLVREGFDGNLRLPAAAALVAGRYRVDFGDLREALALEVLRKKEN